MIKEGKFGLSETVALVTLATITKVFYATPSIVVKLFGTAAWYGTLISVLVSISLFLLVYLLMKRFPGRNLVDIFQDVTGKVIGKILALLFCGYFLYYAGSSIREFTETIKAYTLPYTEPSVILGTFILVIAIINALGLEVIARLSYAFIFPIVIGLFILLALASSLYDPDYLHPILGHGIKTTLFHGLMRSSAYDEAITLAFIVGSVHGLKQFRKAGVAGIGLSGAIISICLFCYLTAFEYFGGTENVSALFQLSRIIYLSRFFQRVESLFLFIWVAIAVISASFIFYITISIYCKTFNIENHRPVIFPFSYLLFMIALIPKNLTEVLEINMMVIREYSLLLCYGIPVLVLIFSVVSGRKGDKASAKKT